MSDSPHDLTAAAAPRPEAALVTLKASFDPSPRELKVHLRISNAGHSAVLLLNRLWTRKGAQPVPDPEKVYRFLRGRNLRLLQGMAPVPADKEPTYVNVPFATRLEPGATLEEEIRLSTPVKEHNVYFAVQADDPYAPVKAESIEFFLEYVVDGGALKTQPSPFDAKALKLVTPGAWDAAQFVRSGTVPLTVDVQRRTDDFERLILPGEPP